MRKLSTIYPGKITVDANNPDGTFKNEVTPGVSADGTPLEEQWQQDIWGWIAHLLNKVSVSPDGVQENEATSQIYDALEAASKTLWTATEIAKGSAFLRKRILTATGSDADHDIDFSAGNFIFSGGDGTASVSAMTKQLDATWAAGSAAGGLASALTIANDTTYYCFALSNADGSTTDFGYDTSSTAANLLIDAAVVAAGLTKYSYVRRLLTDGSANILPATQNGNIFIYDSNISDLDYSGNLPTSRTTLGLTLPTGSDLDAIIAVRWFRPTVATAIEVAVRFTNLDNFDDPPAIGANPIFDMYMESGSNIPMIVSTIFNVGTDSSAQIGYRAAGTIGTTLFDVNTKGWVDHLIT